MLATNSIKHFLIIVISLFSSLKCLSQIENQNYLTYEDFIMHFFHKIDFHDSQIGSTLNKKKVLIFDSRSKKAIHPDSFDMVLCLIDTFYNENIKDTIYLSNCISSDSYFYIKFSQGKCEFYHKYESLNGNDSLFPLFYTTPKYYKKLFKGDFGKILLANWESKRKQGQIEWNVYQHTCIELIEELKKELALKLFLKTKGQTFMQLPNSSEVKNDSFYQIIGNYYFLNINNSNPNLDLGMYDPKVFFYSQVNLEKGKLAIEQFRFQYLTNSVANGIGLNYSDVWVSKKDLKKYLSKESRLTFWFLINSCYSLHSR